MINIPVEKRLTTRQAIFAREIAKEKTQRQACIVAYPNTQNWTINALDVRASSLMKNKAVKKELQKINNTEIEKVVNLRHQITRIIVDIILENELELKRISATFNKIEKAQNDKIEYLKKQLKKYDKKDFPRLKVAIEKETENLIELQKKQVISSTNTNAILNAIRILCNMYGWRNIGWENMNAYEEILTIEELEHIKQNNA